MTYEYEGTVVRVIDGDTVILSLKKEFSLDIDFGFHIKDTVHLHKEAIITFRLLGINTPEIVGASKADGLKAKAELERLLSLGTIKVISEKADKYGRWLATLIVTDSTGIETNVNETLVKTGFAVIYMAG